MMNVKKCLAGVLLGLFGLPVLTHAQPLICPFKDNFSIDGPSNVRILHANVEGNLTLTQPNSISFFLSCGNDKLHAGDLFINIGKNEWNKCSLTIHDGPYVTNPFVSFNSCRGFLKYIGIDHTLGSYNYKLKFTDQGNQI